MKFSHHIVEYGVHDSMIGLSNFLQTERNLCPLKSSQFHPGIENHFWERHICW